MNRHPLRKRPRDASPANQPRYSDPRAMREPALTTGRKAAAVRVRVDYEASVPRCETCRHFRGRRTHLVDGAPVAFPDRCRQHLIACEPAGVCATWEDKATGEKLEELREN